eukprot:m.307268 g.307268  ORF g.307268 m.307268 type:complete len:641 (+) comp42091_c0_seq1:607-2529(+)
MAASGTTTFRRLLLSRCQEEFDNRAKATAAFDKKEGLTPEEEEQRIVAKRKMLGNIRFIGELAKCGMLHESILHRCIQKLLEKKRHEHVADMSESIECLCSLLKVVGKQLDTPKAKGLMNQYFERMKVIQSRSGLPMRMCFMLDDVVLRRKNRWQTPSSDAAAGPKTITELRELLPANQRVAIAMTEKIRSEHAPSGSPRSRRRRGGGDGSNSKPGQHKKQQPPSNRGIHNQSSPQPRLGTPPLWEPLNQELPLSLRSQGWGQQGKPTVVIQEKSKPGKKTGRKVSKQDIVKTADLLVDQWWEGMSAKEAVTSLKENHSMSFMHVVVYKILKAAISRQAQGSEEDGCKGVALFREFTTNDLLNKEEFAKGYEEVLESISDDPEREILVQLGAQAVSEHCVSLSSLAALFDSGKHYPFFLTILVKLHTDWGNVWLKETCEKGGIILSKTLPDGLQAREKLIEILEEKDLIFLYPLLQIQSQLTKLVRQSKQPDDVVTWINDNVDAAVRESADFCLAFCSSVFAHVCYNGSDVETDVKRETQLLELWKPFLMKYVGRNRSLQVTLLFSLQVLCDGWGFPKGLLLRMFRRLYDLDIVDEESFLAWKEDVQHDYPGKGRALFQVNSWLEWLETAEEETTDDESQ